MVYSAFFYTFAASKNDEIEKRRKDEKIDFRSSPDAAMCY
jgi:hypothetical protein